MRGFTLLELLCVLGVLAILVAIALPTANSWRAESDLAKVRTDLAVLQSAAEAYYFKFKTYPPLENYQETLIGQTNLFQQKLLDPLTKAEYIYKLYGRYYIFLSPGLDRVVDFSGADLDLQTGILRSGQYDDVLVTNLKVLK